MDGEFPAAYIISQALICDVQRASSCSLFDVATIKGISSVHSPDVKVKS
jgi:hypothetical protein